MHHCAETDEVFPHAYSFKDGVLHPGEAPGLGVDIDEKLAAQISLQARLPAGEPAGRRHAAQLVAELRRLRGYLFPVAAPGVRIARLRSACSADGESVER